MKNIRATILLTTAGLALVLGVWLVKFGFQFNLTLWLIGFASLPFLLRGSWPALLPITVLGLSLGLWRGQAIWAGLDAYKTFENQNVTVIGSVINDPVYDERSRQPEFYIGKAKIDGQVVPGKLRIRSYTASVIRADTVKITGKLRDGFGSYQAAISYAQTELISRSYSPIEVFRRQFIAKTYSVISEPQASLGLGFLIGVRSLLPDTLTNQLSVTGLTHIIAVSGYNLTILIQLCRKLFARFSRYAAVASSVGLMGSFLMITGNSPSIQRASIVSCMSLLAWYFGRTVSPVVLLSLSAAISAMLQPMFFWFDLGWHLSFLAFFGVLIVAPLIQRRFFSGQPKLLGGMIIETTSAQIMTAPLIAVVFNQVSIISLVANIVVLPLIPLSMLLTFLIGLVAFVWFDLAALIAIPTYYLLSFITNAVAALAAIPWALAQVTMTYGQIAICAACLIITMLAFRRASKASTRATQTDILEAN